MCNRSDAEWMAAYQAGDERAFAELFRHYAPMIERFFLRQGKRRADAQDLTQETFLHVHRGRCYFRRGEPLRPWLFTIARNVGHDHGRRAARRPEAFCELDSFAAQDEARDRHMLGHRERCEALRAALTQLPAADRALLDEHWFADRAFSEIAAREGLQSGTLRVRAHRACLRLREMLAEQQLAVA